MEHPAQVLPDYSSQAFNKARQPAVEKTKLFEGLSRRELPTLHEVRALSSHLYARAVQIFATEPAGASAPRGGRSSFYGT